MSFFAKVGSFAKSTGVAPATQALTGFGFAPQAGHFALILWTSGGTVDGTIQTQATRDARACIGFVSGTAAAEQYAAASVSDTDGGGGGRRTTQKALLLTDAIGATVVSEASVTSLDSDGVTLTWTTNSVTEAQIIHYLAIGGSDVQSKVIRYTSPAGAGNFSTTGAGFQPNLLLTTGCLSALDTGGPRPFRRIGAAMSPSARWNVAIGPYNDLSNPAWRVHRNDRCVFQITNTGTTQAEMDHVSMDADGFTLNQILAGSTSAGVLCLKVPRVAVGTFTKPTGGGPAVGSVSGLGFAVSAVLLASDQDINRANATTQNGSRLGISAFTAAGAESSVLSMPDVPNPLTFAYLEKSAKAAVKINNATPAIDAEATAFLDASGGGFSLTWNANDAVATEYSYVAIGYDRQPWPAPRVFGRTHRANQGRRTRGVRGASRRRTN